MTASGGRNQFSITGVADFRNILAALKGLEQRIEDIGEDAGKDLGDGFEESAPKIKKAGDAAGEAAKRFTATGKEILTAANGLEYWVDEAGRARQANGQFVTSAEKAAAGIGKVGDAAGKSGTGLAGLASSSGILQGAVTGLAFALSNALLNAFSSVASSITGMVMDFAELDGELRKAAAISGENGAYEKLASVVERVGVEAAGTTLEVAQMATGLTRAGFSVDEVSKALPGIVRGAEATGTAFNSMADIVGSTLRGFGLDVSETSRVVDVLVNTANSSNTTVEGLGETFKIAAPIAKTLGISIEDLAATTGLLGNAGISASVAGTALKNSLGKLQLAANGASGESLGLTGNSKQLAAAMRVLGVDIRDANGELLPMDEVLLKLKGSLNSLATGERLELATALFGEEGASPMLAALNQSEADIRKMFGTIRESKGTTDATRDAMQGFQLTLKQLAGTAQSLGATMGGVITIGLLPFVNAANLVLGAVLALPAPVKALAFGLVALTAAYVAARVAQAVFVAALKQEIVATAIADIGKLAFALKEQLGKDLTSATVAMKALANQVPGLSDLLKKDAAVATNLASSAMSRMSDALKNAKANAGATALTLGAVGLAIAGVVVAITAYNAAFGRANEANKAFNETLKQYRQELEAVKLSIEGLEDRQGQIEGFFSRLTSGFAEFVGQTNKIPVATIAATASLEALNTAVGAAPVPAGLLAKAFQAVAATADDMWQGLVQAYNQLGNDNEIRGAADNLNILAVKGEEAVAAANDLRKAFAGVAGQKLTEGQEEALARTLAGLDANVTASNTYEKQLRAQAKAAEEAGNTEFAEALNKQADAVKASGERTDATRQRLLAYTEAQFGATVADKARTLSVAEVNEALKKLQDANIAQLLKDETVLLQEVAAGNITAAAAAEQRQALVRDGLAEELALIDKSLAAGAGVKSKEEEYQELLGTRGELIFKIAQADADAATKKQESIKAEIDATDKLNLAIAARPVRDLNAEIAAGEQLLSFSKAASGLEQERFNTATARATFELNALKEAGASQEVIAQRQAEIEELKKQALIAQAQALASSQGIEERLLELAQQKALLEANMAVSAAQQLESKAQQAVIEADAAGVDSSRLTAAQRNLDLAREQVTNAQKNVEILQATQPLQTELARLSAETAKQQLLTQGASLGIEQALRDVFPAANDATNSMINLRDETRRTRGAAKDIYDWMDKVPDATNEAAFAMGGMTTATESVVKSAVNADGSISIWSETAGKAAGAMGGVSGAVDGIVNSAVNADGSISVWSGTADKAAGAIGGVSDAVGYVARSAVGADGSLHVWSETAGQATGVIGGVADAVGEVSRSAVDANGMLHIWSETAGEATGVIGGVVDAVGEVSRSAVNADGSISIWSETAGKATKAVGEIGGAFDGVGGKAGKAAGETGGLATAAGNAATSAGKIGGGMAAAGAGATTIAKSGFEKAVDTAASAAVPFATRMGNAAKSAEALFDWLSKAAKINIGGGSRFTGGPVEGGQRYRINDGPGATSLGQESFLSAAGRLSLIRSPANSVWTAPSDGTVIPAVTTRKLVKAGVVGPSAGATASHQSVAAQSRGRMAAASPSRPPAGRRGADPTMARLELAVSNLAGQVQALNQKQWVVPVTVRNSAGSSHIRMVNSLG